MLSHMSSSSIAQVIYSIQHAHLSVVFATAQHISSLLSLAPRLPMLRLIVSIDTLTPELRRIASSWATTVNIKVMDLDESEHHPQPL